MLMLKWWLVTKKYSKSVLKWCKILNLGYTDAVLAKTSKLKARLTPTKSALDIERIRKAASVTESGCQEATKHMLYKPVQGIGDTNGICKCTMAE
ncbi:hypothetical protein DPMN_150120 [Dreissena polymorpha]|uniref:Uncharacterized protein n=1 Tax=Dreissena polymorpha TaxID=45954 RepID=A0A9D4J1R5_DREPO|nr:hypothetical protein DPMN_150120 [Dreissena polymorpha]